MQPTNPNIEQSYRTITVIWLGLLVSQFMFLIVLFFTRREIFSFDFTKPLLNNENSMLVIVLAATGILTFLMSFVLRAKFIKQAIDLQKTALVQTAMVIGCALCEATTLFGLVLAFAFGYQYFFLWFALGILGIILHFPKRENLIAASYRKK
ncbi:MAG: hypothetical protein ACR2N3_04220 [Pyrinomonadaceae bacterium]